MNVITKTVLIILFSVAGSGCRVQKGDPSRSNVVYKSEDLVITQLSESCFEHTSFLQTQDYGNVPCNGLVVSHSNEAIVFDTPADDKSSEELIRWIRETLHCKINAVVPTHFHNDCLGGLEAFHKENVSSYAYFKTIELARANHFPVPQNGFKDSLVLRVGNEEVIVKFFGEGHTKDNVTGYVPGEHLLFGGCLIKEVGAGKGYLGDANTVAWSTTVEKIKKQYPDVKIVIPGHGAYGSKKLLDYTIRLFKVKK